MATTTHAARTAVPRRPALERSLAMALAQEEYERVTRQLASLEPQEWTLPSGCPPWDVRALAAHMLGMAEMAASLREQLRQTRRAKRAGGVFIDALTAVQVDARSDLTPAQIVERYARVGPKAARARRRAPRLVRNRTMPDQQPVGGRPDSPTEPWTFGYLLDVVLTRDPWMHRTDIATATGRALELTAEHDGVLVADVVHDWASRHGQPCHLTLTGVAGGSWTFGSGGPHLERDAIEFCRALAGRGAADGLVATEVPF